MSIQFLIDAAKWFIIYEGAQHFAMTGARSWVPERIALTIGNLLDAPSLWVANRSLNGTMPPNIAAVCSSARTTVVPVAMMRPCDA